MKERRLNSKCNSPIALTEEVVNKRIPDYIKPMLNDLADRGIILNTWQALELVKSGDGNRGLGKTQLAYVKIAEAYKEDGIVITCKNTVIQFDPDILNQHMYLDFIYGLKDFIQKYYPDVYRLEHTLRSELHLIPIKSKHRRWWNKGN